MISLSMLLSSCKPSFGLMKSIYFVVLYLYNDLLFSLYDMQMFTDCSASVKSECICISLRRKYLCQVRSLSYSTSKKSCLDAVIQFFVFFYLPSSGGFLRRKLCLWLKHKLLSFLHTNKEKVHPACQPTRAQVKACV